MTGATLEATPPSALVAAAAPDRRNDARERVPVGCLDQYKGSETDQRGVGAVIRRSAWLCRRQERGVGHPGIKQAPSRWVTGLAYLCIRITAGQRLFTDNAKYRDGVSHALGGVLS